MKYLTSAMLGLLLGYGWPQAWAGSFDVGAGLGFADSNDSEGFGGGWDFQAGYEDSFSSEWNIGGQVHHIQGWTSRDKAASDPAGSSMYFQSTALYATARPQHKWLQWLQLKGGVVHADHQTLTMHNDGLGMAVGAGVVLGGENFRFHLLDIEHYSVAGHSFTSYSISVALWGHGTYK